MIRTHHILGLVGLSLLGGCDGRILDFNGTGGIGAAGGVSSVGTNGGSSTTDTGLTGSVTVGGASIIPVGGATGTAVGGATAVAVGGTGVAGGTAVELVTVVEVSANTGGTPSSSICPAASMPTEPTRPGANWQRDPQVDSLLSSMSADDKYTQMYGVPDPADRGSNAYSNIEQSLDVSLSNGKVLRGLKYRDGSRGVDLDARQPNNRPTDQTNYQSYSTAFPAESARAASWDPDFEMKVGEAMGDEVMASLNNVLLAPSVNVLRHPYWGRSQESYGEDVYHVGRMASALTAGIQQHVVACALHYAAYNVENDRSHQDAVVDEQTLREVYTRHFDMVVNEGGVGCVMAAYNAVNDTKCTQNQHLLTDILKAPTAQNGLGFRGFVISDWWAMPGADMHSTDTSLAQMQALTAVNAGLDIEVPWSLNFSQLPNLVAQGKLSMDQINDSVRRVLEQKFRFGIAYPANGSDSKSGPWGLGTADTALGGQYGDSIVKNQNHLDLAEESEIRSAVLLSNGTGGNAAVLPLSSSNPGMKIAVVGLDRKISIATSTNLQPGDDGTLHFATEINTGDRGSSRVNSDPNTSIGPYDGIKAAASSHGLTNVTSGNSVDAAKDADLVVAIVGLNAGDEGEEYSVTSLGDRATLDMPASQNSFVDSLLSLGKPTVVIIESGSIVNVPWLAHSNKNQATIWAGYSGQRGGAAYGKLLFGDRNFSGKLPVSWPQESDMNKLIPFRNLNSEVVTMPYFHGYRLYDLHPEAKLVFPFGWGMSYTSFKYSNLQIPCTTAKKTDTVYVTAEIENTGAVAGDEVMMLFVAGPPKPAGIMGERPVKELKRFQRVHNIQPAGQAKSHYRVAFPLAVQDLRHWEGQANGKWVVDSGDYTISVGPNSANLALQGKLTIVD